MPNLDQNKLFAAIRKIDNQNREAQESLAEQAAKRMLLHIRSYCSNINFSRHEVHIIAGNGSHTCIIKREGMPDKWLHNCPNRGAYAELENILANLDYDYAVYMDGARLDKEGY